MSCLLKAAFSRTLSCLHCYGEHFAQPVELAGGAHQETWNPLVSTSAQQPAEVNCLCLERWCTLSCHPCRRIVPPKPAPGHGQSAFGLNKAPLRRLTHEISAAASSPPGSPLTPASAPAASSASGWCTRVCPGPSSCFLCLLDPCQRTCCLCSSRCVPGGQPMEGGVRGLGQLCSLLLQAVT